MQFVAWLIGVIFLCICDESKGPPDCVLVPDRRHIRLLYDVLHALSGGLAGIRSTHHRSSQHPAPHQAKDEVKCPSRQQRRQDLLVTCQLPAHHYVKILYSLL